MFRTNPSREFQPETVNIEDLVPQDHLLRKINETIDFSFIAEKCHPLYCQDNGRPCIDPVMLFKMLLIGYLYGIRSERRLIEEIRVNIAYRWFVGLSLTDPVPHHTIFSQNRRRRFQQSEIYQEILPLQERSIYFLAPESDGAVFRLHSNIVVSSLRWRNDLSLSEKTINVSRWGNLR